MEKVKVGDVFFNTWGWEQTNVDYFEVIEVTKSGKSVYVRQLQTQRKEVGFMTGPVSPIPGEYIGPPMLKRLQKGSYYSGEGIATKYADEESQGPVIPFEYGGGAQVWNGVPVSGSWYA